MLVIEFQFTTPHYKKKINRLEFDYFLEFEQTYRMLQFLESKNKVKIINVGQINGITGTLDKIDLNNDNARLKYYTRRILFLMFVKHQIKE